MSVHAMQLTSYSTKRAQTCAGTEQVPDVTQYSETRMVGTADPHRSSLPRPRPVLFPAGELPRPAVIGLGGYRGSCKDSAMAIKEILSSVLNISSTAKALAGMNVQDNDPETWEDSSSDDSDNDLDGAASISSSHKDIRFTRHKASWNNTPSDAATSIPLLPAASSPKEPVTSMQASGNEPGTSPVVKCDHCTKVLPGANTSQPKLRSSFRKKGIRRFSSPNLSASFNVSFTPEQQNSPSGRLTSPFYITSMDSIVEDSLRRRSQSYSDLANADNSLTSSTETLTQSTENLFEPTVNLEKENEHFLAAELFLARVENLKSNWQYEQWTHEGGMYWIKPEQDKTCVCRKKANSESATSVDSGYEGLAAAQNSPVETILEEDETDQSGYTIYEGFEDYVIIETEDEDLEKLTTAELSTERRPAQENTAEHIARSLYRLFRQQWMEEDEEAELPSALTEESAEDHSIVADFESSVSLVEEIKRFKMMETEVWCPPRFQVISTLHPFLKRDAVVALQNFQCAGCGTKVEPRYTSKLRYCDYLAKYFCDCCHSFADSPIPARVLFKWDFTTYYVSNFAKNVIDKIWVSHLFNIQAENPALYKKVSDLNRVKEIQEQLIFLHRLLSTCRSSDSIKTAFEAVPSHLTRELHHFTLHDLSSIKQRTLLPTLRELLAIAVAHVGGCEVCQAKGFICEFCRRDDVIFPFQTDTCNRCEACKTCYHKRCFKNKECPKCIRIQAREALRTDSPLTSSGEMDLSSTQ
ncbi:protein associated with UVRAG as autophagy enhancer [Hyperolius riggenbachi]|uniref:protein associated with UVRAG as autophagy enhancer n=1 Tax=Hyperolius riggenbachi TaxID=752182 RepID=UPI0035A36762